MPAAARMWVLDSNGGIAYEAELEKLDIGRKVGVEFEAPQSSNLGANVSRGAIVFVAAPSSEAHDAPQLEMSASLRLMKSMEPECVLGSGNAIMLNDVRRSGRATRYTMISQAASIDGPWRALSCHINGSADPLYDRTIEFSVCAYNAEGQVIGPEKIRVAPFGTAWIDICEIFGAALERHFASSGGKGAYTVYSDEGSAVGYHFLQNRENGTLAADHTRAIRKYMAMGYGGKFLVPPADAFGFARNSARALKFLLSR